MAQKQTLKSIGAVVAGFLTIVVTTTAIDILLHVTGVFPPMDQRMSDGLFVLATSYRIVLGIAGCYVTARLAPARPMKHALILATIGTVLSIAGAAAMWDKGPAWYSLAVIAMSYPCAIIAVKLLPKS